MSEISSYLDLLRYGAEAGIGALVVSGINLILWLTHWKDQHK